MRIGQLRHPIIVQQITSNKDAIGQPIQTWTDVAQVWADIRFLSGLETIKSDGPVSVARASIRIRYREDVLAAMRVVFGSIEFDIKAVLPDANRSYVDLVCETGANHG